MKKQWSIMILTGVLLILAACGAKTADMTDKTAAAQSDKPAWNTISAEEANTRMNSGDPVTVVDVRTAEEYEEKHIPGAILIPNEEIGTEQPALLPDLNAEILVYCRSGRRSAEASKKLAAMGYTNINDFGGINDWTYDTEAGAFQAPAKDAGGSLLADMTTQDLDGNTVDASVFGAHKLTMLNIWATYCGPCINEMPELGELAADYADKDVQVIGIAADVAMGENGYDADGLELAKQIVEKTKADYLHILPSQSLYETLLGGVQAVPTTFFVDEDGNLVGSALVGAKSKDEWASVIDERLASLEE